MSRKANLIFVQLAVFIFTLALTLEGDDNKTDKDVHHEEGGDDEVDDEVEGDVGSMVLQWTHVFLI